MFEARVRLVAGLLTQRPGATDRELQAALAKALGDPPLDLRTIERYRARGWELLRERLSQEAPDFHARMLALVEHIGAEARKAGKLSVALDAAKYLADRFAPSTAAIVGVIELTAEQAAIALEDQEECLRLIRNEARAKTAIVPVADTIPTEPESEPVFPAGFPASARREYEAAQAFGSYAPPPPQAEPQPSPTSPQPRIEVERVVTERQRVVVEGTPSGGMSWSEWAGVHVPEDAEPDPGGFDSPAQKRAYAKSRAGAAGAAWRQR